MNIQLLRDLAFFLFVLDSRAAASSVLPRWGQATTLIYDALFVQGGMTDEFNEYSYTSAPINDELLYLSLSSSFDPSSPPWQLISNSSNSSTSAGPSVAWHTMPALNTSEILLFGGRPAVNSPTVLTVQADSAWLLNVFDRLSPQWSQQATSWANEPIRRIHHTTVTSLDGLVFLIGGEKADGSSDTFSEHYVFDPGASTFTQLPSTNGPPGITGHASVILSNGTLLVFGGYDAQNSSPVSFSTIWALDTTASSYSWTTFNVASSPLPDSRRAFAAVLIEGGKIIIHGGCDAEFQSTYSDGWVLDTSAATPTWSQISALSQIGQRRDHFAVSYGSEVIFGFGYGSSGPALAALQVYNPSDGSFPSSYSPPSSTSPITQTIPGPTQTSYPSGGQSGAQGTGTDGVHPTGTYDPHDPTSTGGGSPIDNNNGNDNKNTTAIAVGSAFGILGLIACAIVIVYYVRRRRQGVIEESRFMILNEDEPDVRIPPVHPLGEKASYNPRWNVLRNISVGGGLTALPGGLIGLTRARHVPQRRDMLADEDTRDFGPWYDRRKRDGSGDSSWSLMSIMRIRSRELSTGSYGGRSPWREKGDPFSDGVALMRDEETGFVGGAAPSYGGSARPSHARGLSYGSSQSASSYRDPFADPSFENQDVSEPPTSYTGGRPYPQPTQPLHVQTMLPIIVGAHPLSPVTEASRGTLTQSEYSGSVSSESHEPVLSPFDSLSRMTSQTSHTPRPSSLFDANTQPMTRSDSWWSRFSRSAFLDRRASGSRHVGGMPEIRDPNPPPRLVAIEESQHSASPENDSPKSNHPNHSNSLQRVFSRRGSKVYRGAHGKSLSSLQTADSETIERMAGMDVAQRERTGSHNTREGTGTSYESSLETWLPEDGRGPISNTASNVEIPHDVTSPTEMTAAEVSAPVAPRTSITDKGPSPVITPPIAQTPSASSSDTSIKTGTSGRWPARPLSGSSVAARVRDYERRMTEEQLVPSPSNTRRHEERSRKKSTVNYGFVPRPSLFVANPDHQTKPSDDS